MRKIITSAVVAAAAAAVIGGTGIAVASTHSTTGTESFQMMSTSATSSNASIIASGVFTAPGVDHESNKGNAATFVFPSGTVSLKHSAGTGKQSFDPKTCLLTIDEHGTYTLTGGTGSYAGITGNGRYQLNILAIGARTGSKCSKSKPPVVFHQVINATGPVTLP
jgi:archaellin